MDSVLYEEGKELIRLLEELRISVNDVLLGDATLEDKEAMLDNVEKALKIGKRDG